MFLQMHVMHNEKLYIKSQSHHLLNNFSITFPVPAKSCFKLQLALTKKKKKPGTETPALPISCNIKSSLRT